jgi:hypothetical protein
MIWLRYMDDLAQNLTRDLTQDLTQAQTIAQTSHSLLVGFQATIAVPEAQRAIPTLEAWRAVQSMVNDRLIPALNDCLEAIEAQDVEAPLATQLRSLNPEVTRLSKLLQIDWQFWQAARQADRIQQRQQQFLTHLKQLEQLLEHLMGQLVL